jgi:hypothetical protein
MTAVVLILPVILLFTLFGVLYWWTRRSEREIGYDKPGLSDEQSNALRFGIAVSVNQSVTGGL